MGAWGKPHRKYSVEFDEDTNAVLDAKLVQDTSTRGTNVFTLVRLYHRHKSTPEFHRRISYVFDSCGQIVKLVVVQYLFDEGVEVPVILCPHGNAKKQVTPHCHTQKTTLDKLKQTVGKPKWVLDAIHEEAGGSFGASSVKVCIAALSAPYNVHYHANLSCPRQRCPNFDPNKVEVPDEVKEKLLAAHWLYIVQTFGLINT